MIAQKKKFFFISVFLLAVMLLFVILNLGRFNALLNYLGYVLRPVIIGLVLAFLCNPIFRMFERKIFFNVHPQRLRRVLSLIATYVIVFLIFFTLIMLIVPQLIESVLDFLNSYDSYLRNTLVNVNELIAFANQNFSTSIPPLEYEEINGAIGDFLSGLDLQNFLNSLLNYTNITAAIAILGEFILIFVDVIFGIFISVYLLYSKERRYAQIMRLRRALFSDRANERITNICTVADRSFGGFLRGKLLDSTIVGVLVYIIISIMQVPYAVLIAVIIGITDIVPVIGPFIGVIPTAVIILLTDPIKVIPFLICILIVQQIDGNIIAPKILGENTGVSSLCVMIAITVMGSLWGLVGMVVGVPLFATVLDLMDTYLNTRLKNKGLPTETESYYGAQTEEKISPERKKRTSRKKRHASGTPKGPRLRAGSENDQARLYLLAQKHNLLSSPSEERLEAFQKEYLSLRSSAPRQ